MKTTILKVAELKSSDYQRQIDWGQINSIANEFDERIFRPITVNQRKDGLFYVVDGQHRVTGFKKAGKKEIECYVTYGLTVEEEAALFRHINSKGVTKYPNAVDDFNAGVIAKDSMHIDINNVVQKHNFSINGMTADNQISAVKTLIAIYKKYRLPVLDVTLEVVRMGFYGSSIAVQGNFLKGLACFLNANKNNRNFKLKILIDKLQKMPCEEILKQLNYRSSISFDFLATDIFSGIYNKHLRPENRI